MSTPAEASTAQAGPSSNRGRGRGRGGGPAPRGRSTRGQAAPKVQLAKIGPNRLLETEWVKDSILKGNCFVLFAGAGVAGDQQWTFHHPIGETPLDEREWVATPTRDISYLLQRRESEALSAWKRKAELAKRHQVLRDRKGRKIGPDGETEVWDFENAPAIQPTIRSCMTAAKAAGANESEWLGYADRAVQSAEQRFKEALRTEGIPAGWVRVNPRPAHETKGGPLGDHPQKAIPFLKGMSQASAKDKVIRVAIGLDTTDDVPVGDSDDEDDEEEDSNEFPAPAVEEATPPPQVKVASPKASPPKPAPVVTQAAGSSSATKKK
jgi:hypothetical protein